MIKNIVLVGGLAKPSKIGTILTLLNRQIKKGRLKTPKVVFGRPIKWDFSSFEKLLSFSKEEKQNYMGWLRRLKDL